MVHNIPGGSHFYCDKLSLIIYGPSKKTYSFIIVHNSTIKLFFTARRL